MFLIFFAKQQQEQNIGVEQLLCDTLLEIYFNHLKKP